MCDFVRKYRYLGLLRGPAGAGKTVSAQRYRDEQPLMTANGQSPILYFQLARGEQNHKAFYRRVIETITRVPYQKRLSAADLISEAKRLLRRYEYDMLIVDEIGNTDNDGLEGARTLYHETGIPMVFIGMDDGFKDHSETQRPQFYSRLAEILEFGLLDRETLHYDVLPQISPHSCLAFDPQQADADEIVDTLFSGAGGSEKMGARFRDVQVLLVRYHDLLQQMITLHEHYVAENPRKRTSKPPTFDADLVRKAIRKSKQRGKEKRSRSAPPGTGPVLNLVGGDDPPSVLPTEGQPDTSDTGEGTS